MDGQGARKRRESERKRPARQDTHEFEEELFCEGEVAVTVGVTTCVIVSTVPPDEKTVCDVNAAAVVEDEDWPEVVDVELAEVAVAELDEDGDVAAFVVEGVEEVVVAAGGVELLDLATRSECDELVN